LHRPHRSDQGRDRTSESDNGTSTDIDRRIARLEKKIRYLSAGLFLFVAASVAVLLYDAQAMRRAFVTRYLFTREFNVPPPTEWSAVSVIGGLAPAVNGKSIAFWLAGSPLTADHRQTRIELDQGGQRIDLNDQRGQTRLRLAAAADGTPSITLFDSNGQPIWSAPAVVNKSQAT
jgi:hypothetical protein